MSEMAWVTMRMAEKEEDEEEGRRRRSERAPKVRTPHKDVGNNIRIFDFAISMAHIECVMN